MVNRFITPLLTGVLLIAGLAACNTDTSAVTSGTDTGATTTQSTTSADTATTNVSATSPTVTSAPSATAATVLAENSTPATIEATAETNDTAIQIALQGDTIAVEGEGVTVDGSIATITAAGTYNISGTLNDGQIVVDTDDEATVYLILNGASISSSTSAPIYVKEATATKIILADGTTNTLSDASTYVYASADEDEPNAALFSDDLLVISGGGALTVNGNYNDGIASKDGLTIAGGTITVNAADDGIRGKDYLTVEGGTITVTVGGDGLKSDNADDATMGYISIAGGEIAITAGGDGAQAETDLVVTAGDLTVVAGGGSSTAIIEDLSTKGLKANVNLTLEGGTFAINAADDALHSDTDLTINGGTYTLASGDDGIHGETTLTVNGGDIDITDSYEGIESAAITLNAGNIAVVASDDGVNAAGGSSTNAAATGGMPQGGTSTTPPTGGMPQGGGRGGPGGGMGGGNYTLTINGGTLYVDAGGDGLDANGTMTLNDGVVIVNGPTERMNGALDYDGGFAVSGGTIIAAGSAGMATAPDSTSSQNSLLLFFSAVQSGGTLIHIEDSAGNTVLTFTPTKEYQSLAFSSATLTSGETYTVYLGGSTTSTAPNGFVTNGDYTGGTEYTTFTVSGTVTQVGEGGGFGGGRR